MSFDPISAALDIGSKIIDRVWPDPAQANAAKLQLLQMQQNGDLAKLTSETDLAKAQIAVDQAEAASSDPLQHWRGGAGWVCVAALAYNFIVSPLGTWLTALCGHPVPMPVADNSTLFDLMGGMLGLGGWHVLEKVKGVA